MTSADYSKLLAISVLAAIAIAAVVPSSGPISGESVLQKSDRLPVAALGAQSGSDLPH